MTEDFEKKILKKGLFKKTKNMPSKNKAAENKDSSAPSNETGSPETLPQTLKIVKFRLENYEFGVDVNQIEKVVWMVEITKVPNAPGIMEGIIDFQGRLVPVIDLHKILGLSARNYKKDTQIIITKVEGKILGLIIDKIQKVFSLERDDIIQPDESIPLREMLSGVAETPLGLMPIIDLGKVISLKEGELKQLAGKYSSLEKIMEDESEETRELREVFHERAMELAEKREEKEEDREDFLVFALGKEWYALDLENIKEELRPSQVVPLPSLSPSVLGVINLRGDILAVISLKKLFQLSDSHEEDNFTRFIVIEKENMKFCLVVDKVEEIFSFPLNSIDPPLSTLEQSKLNYLKGEVNHMNRLIGIINLDNIIRVVSESAGVK